MDEKVCKYCQGEGRIIVGENLISSNIVIDGHDKSYIYKQCNVCGGTGKDEKSENIKEKYTPTSFLDSNGLVDGNIPPNQPCPFFKKCKMKTNICPSCGNEKEHRFSCALARAHSIMKERNETK